MLKKSFFLITMILLVISLGGLGCKGLSQVETDASKPIVLNYWRVYDDSDSFAETIAAFQALHPQITINYRKLRPEEFQTELLNALAEDKGPDMFSVQNTWLRVYQSKILPLPPTVKSVYQRVEGKYQKKLVVDVKTLSTLTPKQVEDKFVGAVADNVVINSLDPATNQYKPLVYGLPLGIDTLVMYYNKDLLDQAGIASPPKNWSDFQKNVISLTKIDSENNILNSGAAIGTGANVLSSSDILSVLMMQNGTKMANEAGVPIFNQIPAGLTVSVPPGEQALQFYTDFAQPTKQVYTWNGKMPESLDAFVRGQTAFFFGYSYHLPLIRARAAKLNFSIAPLPQVNTEKPINFASFWVETVSKKTKYPNEAWDFILFASNPQNVVKYLTATKKPTALRELVSEQVKDEEIGVFASELLTAKTWYKGKDAGLADKYFKEMIDGVFNPEIANDPDLYRKAINNAVGKIGQTL